MGGPKVWQPMLLLVLLHVLVEIMALCPAGYVESMGMCVPQTSPTCPPNYVLRNGLCYPATSSSSTNTPSPCQTQAIATPPCSSQVACANPPVTPCTTQQIQPCATQLFPATWTQQVQPCLVQPVQPCPNQPIQLVQPYPNQPIQSVQPCPNQPIQPVQPCPNQPIQPVQPWPNQPIQPIQPCPYQPIQPVQPCKNQPIQSVQPCLNQPIQSVQPCPNQSIQPVQPYPNQPIQPVQPCPHQSIQPVQPYPNQPIQSVQPCPNQSIQPVQPYPNQPIQSVQPCLNQPIQSVQPCPNQSIQPVQPYPNQPIQPVQPRPVQPIQPVQPCPNLPIQPVQPCPVQPVTTTAPTPHETTRTTTAIPITYPPDPIMRCPEGTALINGVCRLIYCGKGVYKDHKCVKIQCRPGTVWTGVQCASPAPIVQSIVLNNTVITHFNRTGPNVIINNVNNLVVNAAPNCTDVDSGEATSSCPEVVTSPPDQTNCCAVVTPRMCRRSEAGDHWNCFSKRYRRCGDFCIAPTIYLKPPMIRDTNRGLVMLPDHALSDCRRAGTCAESINYHDCSGCAMGVDENCSSYCSKSTCGTRSCRFYDQKLYCARFPGQEGCQETDGCVDDWCSNDEY